MKQNKLVIFLITLILIIPNVVLAYERANNDKDLIFGNKVSSHEYKAVCSYKTVFGPQDWAYGRINIYYIFESNKWLVASDAVDYFAANPNSTKVWKKSGTFSKVFSKSGDNIHISENVKNNLKNGVCPSDAWFINDGATTRICFGDKNDCNVAVSNKSIKNYDIYDDITEYFKINSPKINSCEELRKKSFNIQKKIEEDFINNFMHSNPIPSFIVDSTAYKEGMENKKIEFADFKNQCDNKINNQDLSDEEKKELLEQNQAGLEEAINQIDNVDEKIKGSILEINTGKIDCNDLTNGRFGKLLKSALSLIRYSVPIIILGLSIKDFIKAIAFQDNSMMRKVMITFSKRMVIGVLIFILPTLLDFILKLAGVECGIAGLG